MNTLLAILNNELVKSILLGVILYAGATAITSLVARNQSIDGKRFWKLTFRNCATAAFVVGLGIIWRSELQSVIVALGAAAAGFLIAFKEQWQSLLAFWIRVVKRPYSLNDFIEIDGIRGRVIDITWLTTSIAETGLGKDDLSYSGRVVHVPNVRMLMANFMVENLTGFYSVHTIEVPLPKESKALKAEAVLQQLAEEACRTYIKPAERHMQSVASRRELDTPDVHPRTRLHFGKEGAITVLLRVVVPSSEKAKVEQDILHRFLFIADSDPSIWPSTKS